MNIKKLNYSFKKLLEDNNYHLTIITGRDRDSDGEITEESFSAKNDVDAFIKVLTKYNTCCSGWFNGDYEEDELEEEEKARNAKLYSAAESGQDQEESIAILSELYNDSMDISDYYDDIISIEGPNGTVFEDDIDLEGWFGNEDDDLEVDVDNKIIKEQEKLLLEMIKEVNLECKDCDITYEGLSAYLNLPGEYYAVADIKSDPNVEDKPFSVEIFGVKDALIGNKILNDASIEEVKQFLLDNYDQMVKRNKYLKTSEI